MQRTLTTLQLTALSETSFPIGTVFMSAWEERKVTFAAIDAEEIADELEEAAFRAETRCARRAKTLFALSQKFYDIVKAQEFPRR